MRSQIYKSYKIKIKDNNFIKRHRCLYEESYLEFLLVEKDVILKIEAIKSSDRSNSIIVTTTFFKNKKQIDYFAIDLEISSILISAYYDYVLRNTISKENVFKFSVEKLINLPKSLLNVKLLTKVKQLIRIYSDLRSVQICSVLGNMESRSFSIIGKSSIELDADIVTIVPENSQKQCTKNLRRIHVANTCFANYIFLYPLIKVFTIIRVLKLAITVIPFPIIYLFSFSITLPIFEYEILPNLITAVFSTIGGVISRRYLSRLIGSLIKKIVFG